MSPDARASRNRWHDIVTVWQEHRTEPLRVDYASEEAAGVSLLTLIVETDAVIGRFLEKQEMPPVHRTMLARYKERAAQVIKVLRGDKQDYFGRLYLLICLVERYYGYK